MMSKRKKLTKLLLGLVCGILISRIGDSGTQKSAVPPCEEDLPNKGQKQQLLLVGVMTAKGYLENRAKAVWDTWGREVPGRLIFYSSASSKSAQLPLVPLAGVDDSYPPQKKSFMMLKHMHDHFVDEYEWFLRADDDVYIRTDRLERLLRSIDSKKPWFIGQTGRGNSEEFGMLSLDEDENFCMGGPGVIFSRETLKRIAPFVEQCLQELYTNHEDVELGRCVKKYAGVSCTWSYEMQVILYHNQSGSNAFTGDLKQKEVHRAITMHPVKQPKHMLRLHDYVKALRIQEYQQQQLDLHRDIATSMSELNFRPEHLSDAFLAENLPLFSEKRGSKGYLGDTSVLGVPLSLTRHSPKEVGDVLEWELISKTLYSHKDLNPRRRIGSTLKEGLGDVIRDIMELINSYSKQRGRVIDFKDILYGYWRVDPLHGVDLILDLLLVYRKYRGHKMTVQVRRHAYVQQTFIGLFVREIAEKPARMPFHERAISTIFRRSAGKQVLHFILPLSGRHPIFRRFAQIFEEICLKQDQAAVLVVVLYRNSEDYALNKKLVNYLQGQYGNSVICIEINDNDFNRAKALEIGLRQLSNESLLVFIDVDIVFAAETLFRIRKNTVENRSIYFPIVYSLYNPKVLNKTQHLNRSLIDEDTGFWRQFGFGIVSLYKSDYFQIGGFNLNINGWGGEDVIFFDQVIKSNLTIFRAVDPDLIHVYHAINCDSGLDTSQKAMCLGTKATLLGSYKQLAKLYKKYAALFIH